MKKRKKGRRFKIPAVRQSPEPRAMEKEPEALAVSVRRAAKEVLPIIKGVQLDPGAVQFPLAQQTQVLVPGDPRFTTESGMAIANRALAGGILSARTGVPLHTGKGTAGATGRPKGKGERRGMFPAVHSCQQRDTTRLR